MPTNPTPNPHTEKGRGELRYRHRPVTGYCTPCGHSHPCVIHPLLDEIDRLRGKVQTFLDKYDLVEPAMVAAFAFQQNHIGPYTGENWSEELGALREALNEETP